MTKTVKDLCRIEYGASPKQIRSDDNTGICIYGTGGFVGYSKEPLFNEPLIVVARKGTLDKPIYVDLPCWVIDTAYAAIPKNNVDVKWLFYQLQKFDLSQLNESTGVPSISRNYLYKQQIPYQTQPEQHIIATILSTVDEVIEKTETAIAKYKAIKAGMMQDLFTRGIDVKTGKLRPSYHEAPELYKETELGWIPKEWEIVKIGEFSKIKGGKRLPAGRELSDAITPFPYLRVTDMQDGTIKQDDIKYVPVNIEPFIRNYKISVDDVYVTIAGTLGLFGTIPAILDQTQLTENAAKICEFDKTVYDRDFIKYQCNSQIIQNQVIREIGVGGGVPKLALFRIAKFKLLKPLINEQTAIVERIQVIENEINKESVSLKKYNQVKQGLMADLLTGKVRVNQNENIVENG